MNQQALHLLAAACLSLLCARHHSRYEDHLKYQGLPSQS